MSHAVARGELAEAELRIRAQRYVSGVTKEGTEDIAYLIDKGLMTVVIDPRLRQSQEWSKLVALLQKNGFTLSKKTERFSVYTISRKNTPEQAITPTAFLPKQLPS